MKYIDLSLRSATNNEKFSLSDVLENHPKVIVLGAPGSGKTSILKLFDSENNNAQYFSVKEFLKFNPEVKTEKTILLLDGLDEYRLTNSDKSFVVKELADKIDAKNYSNKKIVISCRELDWNGEMDLQSLKKYLKKDFSVWGICPLDESQQREIALKDVGILNVEDFLEKYSATGFLLNPHLLSLCAQLYHKDNNYEFSSPIDIYSKFIEEARESNPSYTQNLENLPDKEKFQNIIGYLAFFYIFANIDTFDNETIENLSSQENGFSKELLNSGINSKVFSESCFIHRSIAEFAAGFFVSNQITKEEFSIDRIKTLFMSKHSRIPTEYRGTYSWLSSISCIDELLNIDPVHLAMLGDSSLLSSSQKKMLIRNVKQHARENLYFIADFFRTKINGLYTPEIDDFLISEWEEAIKLKNNYVIFLAMIMNSGDKKSAKIIDFIKKIMLDHNIDNSCKAELLNSVINDEEYCRKLLNKAVSKKSFDPGDRLKEYILTSLYPKIISPTEVYKYIESYQEHEGHLYYLLSTPLEDSHALVVKLLEYYKKQQGNKRSNLPTIIDLFITKYLVKLALSYDPIPASEIYQRLKEINSYYELSSGPSFYSYNSDLKKDLNSHSDKLIELANELFSLYVDDQIAKSNGIDFFLFKCLYGFKKPTKIFEILKSKLNKSRTIEKNKKILKEMLYFSGGADKSNEELCEIAQEYGLLDEMKRWLEPPRNNYKLEWEKKEKKRKAKEQARIKDNEEYISKKSDEELIADFNILYHVTTLITREDSKEYERYLTEETFHKLKGILKSALLASSISKEYMSIESIAKNSPDACRCIDLVYYVSCQLNSSNEYECISDKDYLGYLYIISIRNNRSSDVIHGDFIRWYEEDEKRTSESLKEYFTAIITNHFPDDPFSKDISDKVLEENNLVRLKNVLNFFLHDMETVYNQVLYSYLREYRFEVDTETLCGIKEHEKTSKKNQLLCNALYNILMEKKDDFTKEMAGAIFNRPDIREGVNLNDIIGGKQQEKLRVRIVDYMMHVYNTVESFQPRVGYQSITDRCAAYLNLDFLKELNPEELKQLKESHNIEEDIWRNLIIYKINEFEKKEADSNRTVYSISGLKDFLFSKSPCSLFDFFSFSSEKIQKLIEKIELNENNEKLTFHDLDKEPKKEERCRDIFHQLLENRYGRNLLISREHYIGDFRADLRIQYRGNPKYELVIECKKDDNRNVYTSLTDQLISKYVKRPDRYGIYLIFFFGDKPDKNGMIAELTDKIPEEYCDDIKILVLDLTL